MLRQRCVLVVRRRDTQSTYFDVGSTSVCLLVLYLSVGSYWFCFWWYRVGCMTRTKQRLVGSSEISGEHGINDNIDGRVGQQTFQSNIFHHGEENGRFWINQKCNRLNDVWARQDCTRHQDNQDQFETFPANRWRCRCSSGRNWMGIDGVHLSGLLLRFDHDFSVKPAHD